ncbi:MAG: hypothetical protein ACRD5B_11135 [Nitrososphaeraceae archaeon]
MIKKVIVTSLGLGLTLLGLLLVQQPVNAQYIDIIEKLREDLANNSTTAGRDALRAFNEAEKNETKGFTSAERDVLDASKKAVNSACPSKYPELAESCAASRGAIDIGEDILKLQDRIR